MFVNQATGLGRIRLRSKFDSKNSNILIYLLHAESYMNFWLSFKDSPKGNDKYAL